MSRATSSALGRVAACLAIGLAAACAGQTAAPSETSTSSADPPGTARVDPATSAVRPRPSPPDPALVERLRADVQRIAIRRDPGSPGWRDVRATIEARLREQKWEPAEDTFAGGGIQGINVIARRKGTASPDATVILSAHYDHVWDCAGADDNASGVAVVLEAARALSDYAPTRSLVLAFWDYEEDGLIGSTSWAKRAKLRGEKIELAIALDGVGYVDPRPGSQSLPPGADALLPDVSRTLKSNDYRGDFIAVIADSDSEKYVDAFAQSADARGLPAVTVDLSGVTRVLLLDAARSDHASFWLLGYPAMLVTDTANFRNPRYHCAEGSDTPDSLDYAFLARVTGAVIEATKAAAK
ncbi:MAG TPA: M20/M25/M40 family metallo-hydrolase [Polyangiaceae bacterium]|nr:M20/M25/M40 family metallo-hydrolase [Polyangiaceae bacterium]